MYRNLNDYELLYMIREGDDTFSYLYQKYQPLIYKMVKKYVTIFKKYGYELDDLMQIGNITLYKASQLYSFYNDTMFYSYFIKSLKNAILDEIDKNRTLRRETLNNSLFYDQTIGDSDSTFLEIIGEEPKEKSMQSEAFIVFKNSMSFDMGNVFELFINGYNFQEISKLLDMKIDKVYHLFQKIKTHALTYKSLFLD